jgi:hypothetical protein
VTNSTPPPSVANGANVPTGYLAFPRHWRTSAKAMLGPSASRRRARSARRDGPRRPRRSRSSGALPLRLPHAQHAKTREKGGSRVSPDGCLHARSTTSPAASRPRRRLEPRQPGPLLHVEHRGGAERAEVAQDHVFERRYDIELAAGTGLQPCVLRLPTEPQTPRGGTWTSGTYIRAAFSDGLDILADAMRDEPPSELPCRQRLLGEQLVHGRCKPSRIDAVHAPPERTFVDPFDDVLDERRRAKACRPAARAAGARAARGFSARCPSTSLLEPSADI